MFGYTTIKNIIGRDVVLSQTMIDAINDWKKMLNGEAEWLTDSIKSLRIEHGICREFWLTQSLLKWKPACRMILWIRYIRRICCF